MLMTDLYLARFIGGPHDGLAIRVDQPREHLRLRQDRGDRPPRHVWYQLDGWVGRECRYVFRG